MSLECRHRKDSLHWLGRETLKRPTTFKVLSEAARAPETSQPAPDIPRASLFNFTEDSRHEVVSSHKLPSVSECATHLELLEVFYVLRQRILTSEEIDKSMGIEPIRTTKTGRNGDTRTFKDSTLWTRRQDKWPKFIEFAAVRFLVWRQSLTTLARDTGTDKDTPFDVGILPPLDVLMVWHSFMLNPALMFRYCKGEPIMRLKIPWELIHNSITKADWTFSHDDRDATQFTKQTGLPADLLDQFSNWLSQSDTPDTVPKLSSYSLHETSLDESDETERPVTAPISISGEMWSDIYSSLFETVRGSLAVELRDAVLRQASFVDKMNAHMWIRSPALEGTICRGTDRYTKFLQLLKRYPQHTIVPTLDIDLVWHTHQCGPVEYRRATKAIVGRFINHNDTIAQDELGDGFEITRKYFRVQFGKEYRVCGCWDCEALLSALEVAAEVETDGVDMAAIAQRAKEQVSYYRAVEIAVRKRAKIPLPDDFIQ